MTIEIYELTDHERDIAVKRVKRSKGKWVSTDAVEYALGWLDRKHELVDGLSYRMFGARDHALKKFLKEHKNTRQGFSSRGRYCGWIWEDDDARDKRVTAERKLQQQRQSVQLCSDELLKLLGATTNESDGGVPTAKVMWSGWQIRGFWGSDPNLVISRDGLSLATTNEQVLSYVKRGKVPTDLVFDKLQSISGADCR